MAADPGAMLAGHPALELMDWGRGFRPTHDCQVDGGMQIATCAAYLEIAKAGIEGVTQHGGRVEPVP